MGMEGSNGRCEGGVNGRCAWAVWMGSVDARVWMGRYDGLVRWACVNGRRCTGWKQAPRSVPHDNRSWRTDQHNDSSKIAVGSDCGSGSWQWPWLWPGTEPLPCLVAAGRRSAGQWPRRWTLSGGVVIVARVVMFKIVVKIVVPLGQLLTDQSTASWPRSTVRHSVGANEAIVVIVVIEVLLVKSAEYGGGAHRPERRLVSAQHGDALGGAEVPYAARLVPRRREDLATHLQ